MEMNVSEKTITNKVPSLGFLGLSWIGKTRMEKLLDSRYGEGKAICDVNPKNVYEALKVVPKANVYSSLEELLEEDLDGIVIATPSALHAKHTLACLKAGKAVFCQKPLGRNLQETRQIVEEAHRVDKLLGVDYSYRFTEGMRQIKTIVDEGQLGQVYAIETVYHNACGPDKSWFYDPQLSGGGCLMDLGSHLIDLILWILKFPAVEIESTCIRGKGKPIVNHWEEVEDYATTQFKTSNGVHVQMSCSWNLPIGKDAEIIFRVFGTKGGVSFHNVEGSADEFECAFYKGKEKTILSSPPDEWGSKALINWSKDLAKSSGYRNQAEEFIRSASVLDEIYRCMRS
jgi:predicted dehydrogenase